MIKPTIKTLPALLLAIVALGGCASLEPGLPAADAAIPAAWPAEATAPAGALPAADVGWRDFVADPKLQELVSRALLNNRDLRVAVLNVERTRAQYNIQRAERFPALGANASMTRGSGSATTPAQLYTASLGVAAFELDLFGRVRNLSGAALERYFAQEQSRRSAHLALISEVANVYFSLAADRESLRIANATLKARQAAYDLVVRRHQLGAVSALDMMQAQTTVHAAAADVARFSGLVATDVNALNLLVGSPVESALLPESFNPDTTGLAPLPPGLPSEVLLRRPDVLQAEHLLRAANANIGAARAAYFPSISLTGSVGSASTELSGLFGSGSGIWSFMPQVNLPLFQGGRLRGNLDAATAERNIALANYEKSIQAGFREVADALALTGTLAEQRAAQERLVEAASRGHELSKARYDRGQDSFLNLLDAQRTLYAAQQGLVAAQLAEQGNRVVLYRALGGGWKERS